MCHRRARMFQREGIHYHNQLWQLRARTSNDTRWYGWLPDVRRNCYGWWYNSATFYVCVNAVIARTRVVKFCFCFKFVVTVKGSVCFYALPMPHHAATTHTHTHFSMFVFSHSQCRVWSVYAFTTGAQLWGRGSGSCILDVHLYKATELDIRQ